MLYHHRKTLWYHRRSPILESHVISYIEYHMWYWMSNVKLSIPQSKQLNLALHSRRFMNFFFATWFTVFATFFKFSPHPPTFLPHTPIFSPQHYVRLGPAICCELCQFLADSVTRFTIKKCTAMSWARLSTPTATDGVREAHVMRPVERTQLSRERSECLVGPLAGIWVFVGPVGKTQIYHQLYCL
jgi:hypothetical protein